MRHVLGLIVVTALLWLADASVQAEPITYLVSGMLGSDDSGTTGLAGGSYVGTFVADGFPLAADAHATVGAYSLSVFNASGTLITMFSDPTGGDGNIFDARGAGANLVEVYLGDPTDPNGNTGILLDFPIGFTGTGAVIPTDFGVYFSLASQYDDANSNVVSIASGYSSPAMVPEPSSLILAGLGALMALGLRAGRRRERVEV